MRDEEIFLELEPPPGGGTRLFARVRADEQARAARGLRLAFLPVSLAARAVAVFVIVGAPRATPTLTADGDPAAVALGMASCEPTLTATPGRVAWLAPSHWSALDDAP